MPEDSLISDLKSLRCAFEEYDYSSNKPTKLLEDLRFLIRSIPSIDVASCIERLDSIKWPTPRIASTGHELDERKQLEKYAFKEQILDLIDDLLELI